MGFSLKKLFLILLLVCIASMLLIFPLVLRFKVFATAQVLIEYQDMIPMRWSVSTWWCENNTLRLETASFNAYLLEREELQTEHTVQVKRVHVPAKSFRFVAFYFMRSSKFRASSCPVRPCKAYLLRGIPALRACLRVIQGSPPEARNPLWNESSPIPAVEGPVSNAVLPNSTGPCAVEAFLDLHPKCPADDAFYHHVLVDDYYFLVYVNDPAGHTYNDVELELSAWRSVFNRNQSLARCIEVHECTFPLTFGSSQFVVVERPRKSVISNDPTLLTSRCNPRRKVYLLFYIAFSVLFIIIAFQ